MISISNRNEYAVQQYFLVQLHKVNKEQLDHVQTGRQTKRISETRPDEI